jgi:hypothetical protein
MRNHRVFSAIAYYGLLVMFTGVLVLVFAPRR